MKSKILATWGRGDGTIFLAARAMLSPAATARDGYGSDGFHLIGVTVGNMERRADGTLAGHTSC
jgi:hypothetical protein